MRRFGELPEDHDKQDTSMGPPPPRSWWNSQSLYNPLPLPGFLLGETTEEINMLTELKKNQDYSKDIPAVAIRYTDISPVSPFFRKHVAKYGFGEETWKPPTLLLLVLLAGLWQAL